MENFYPLLFTAAACIFLLFLIDFLIRRFSRYKPNKLDESMNALHNVYVAFKQRETARVAHKLGLESGKYMTVEYKARYREVLEVCPFSENDVIMNDRS